MCSNRVENAIMEAHRSRTGGGPEVPEVYLRCRACGAGSARDWRRSVRRARSRGTTPRAGGARRS